jgi:hypothetical protein
VTNDTGKTGNTRVSVHASGDRFGRFFRRLTLITAKGFGCSFFSL